MMRHPYLSLVLIACLGFVLLASLPGPAEEAASKEKIDKLIKQLGDGSFAERQNATQALDAIGAPALEALRKAAHSDDAEVRRRAGDLVKNIETRLVREKVLAGKRVHLVYKDLRVKDALADFQKKSGYFFHLHDPDNKLKDRIVTLDTGETSFWHAYELFCARAGLVKATERELVQSWRGSPPEGPRIQVGGLSMHPLTPGIIHLKDGKPPKMPTDDSGGVRIRALPPSPPAPGVDPTDFIDRPEVKEVALSLEVTPEPRFPLQRVRAVRVEKAIDEKGQTLKPGRMSIGDMRTDVCLKKGAKAAKSLKELQGVLSVQVLTEPVPVLTVADLARAAGKTFKGPEGGSLKVLDVKTDDRKTTIQLELERPINLFPAQSILLQPAPVPSAKGAAPAQIQIPKDGFVAFDDKGNALPIRITEVAVGRHRSILKLQCHPPKGQGSPTRLVFLGCKSVIIDIPFILKGKMPLQAVFEA